MEHLQVLCAFKIHITKGFFFSWNKAPLWDYQLDYKGVVMIYEYQGAVESRGAEISVQENWGCSKIWVKCADIMGERFQCMEIWKFHCPPGTHKSWSLPITNLCIFAVMLDCKAIGSNITILVCKGCDIPPGVVHSQKSLIIYLTDYGYRWSFYFRYVSGR